MDPHLLSVLIRKYRSGQATDEERAQLEAYWQQHASDDSYLQSLSAAEREALRTRMFRNIRQGIARRESTPANVRRLVPGRRVFWPVAAAVSLLLLVSLIFVYYLNTDEYRTERTVYGQQKEIILPDSSVVLLNGNSSVRYAAAWPADRHREIWLEGEAYFSVRHTRNHRKFTVRTPDQLAVEVLGTRFSVTNRRGTTEVVLAEGKVQVSDARDSYLMQPGDMIRYSRQDRQLVPQRTNPERAISWKDKLLIFEDEPVENIVQRLRDSHGIRVEFRNRSIPGELFNGSIPGDSVEVFFDKLEKLYPVRISRQNDIYIIE